MISADPLSQPTFSRVLPHYPPPPKFQLIALGNHINLPNTRDYSDLNFTNLAGLSMSVSINEVFCVVIFHMEWFLD